MKKVIKIFASLFLLVLLIGGCENSLDSAPFSFTSVENFYKTEADVELAVSGCYNTLIAGRIQGEGNWSTFAVGAQLMLNGATDECVTRDGFSNPEFSPFGLASYTPDNELIRKNWFFFYAGINRVNTLLEKIDEVEMSESRKKEIKGEAQFLRGLFYMYLGMMYGGVPVYTTSDQDPEAPRQSVQEVFGQVIADFKSAYEILPPRATIKGRANKWSAAGFLAKVYTYLGSCKLNNVGSGLSFDLNSFNWVDSAQMYQNAKAMTQDIIDNSGYALIDEYDYLFRETTEEWQYKECLFTVESSDIQTSGNDYGIWLYFMIPTGNANRFGGGFGWFRPVAEMYYRYDANDKRRGHNVNGVLNVNSDTEDIEGVKYYVPSNEVPSSRRYSINKFRYKDPALKTITVSYSEGNYPLLRYADILLLHAEALYFTGNEAGAREVFARIRERSLAEDANIDVLNTAYYKGDFIEELLDERSRELCFESWRRIDLVRFKKYGEAIDALSDDAAYGVWNTVVPLIRQNWGPHRIWFPIPASQIDLNSSLIQNPGY